MTDEAASPSRPPSREAQKLRDDLLRQGFSPEEADLAMQDAGIVAPGPTGAYPGAPGPGGAGYAPGHGGAGHAPGQGDPTATGRTSYLLGLLAWLPVPFVSAVIAGIAMAAAYPGQRKRSALAAENARGAANWGLTYALGVVLSVALTIVLGVATQPETPDPGTVPWPLFLLLAIPVLSVAHLVVTVLGLTRTARGEVYVPRAVPFFRATQSPSAT
ncbi:DUF4870 domain-containing protein [Cellulomonas sp. NS3]|uniref:DUF4870 domain-containing protein n=1 Tax=Cellulomonas sp. NS3 TaxID=2973977 RepID=UPI002162D932|nr:DUF4870 domain-containing protein [Cellulomonas sp. NS3]